MNVCAGQIIVGVCACARCKRGKLCDRVKLSPVRVLTVLVHAQWVRSFHWLVFDAGARSCVHLASLVCRRYLAAFPRLRRRMLNFMSQTVFDSIRGTCDSEHVYESTTRRFGCWLVVHPDVCVSVWLRCRFGVFLTLVGLKSSFREQLSPDTLRHRVVETVELLRTWSMCVRPVETRMWLPVLYMIFGPPCREEGITEPSLLNFAVTDGATVIV
jgi:hypothetical protein